MNNQTNKKDIALNRFLSWPKDAREAYLELRFPNMMPAMRSALLRDNTELQFGRVA